MWDIVIVGGGLIGRALAIALQDTPFKIAIVESQALKIDQYIPSLDRRTIALTPKTAEMLQKIGVWADLQPYCTPILHIHVSNQGYCGFTRIHAEEEGLPSLGYRVLLDDLAKILALHLPSNVTILCPATVKGLVEQEDHIALSIKEEGGEVHIWQAECVIACDGAESFVRHALGIEAFVFDYEQVALVGNITVSEAHQNWAYERFTKQGPFALLPGKEETVSFVWTVSSKDADRLLALEDIAFLKAAQDVFGYRAGRFLSVGKRGSYPLKLVVARALVTKRAIVMGNAGQSLHPVAGQGFNLGLRDVAAAASFIKKEGLLDLSWFKDYATARESDRETTIQTTHLLVKGFSHSWGSIHRVTSLLMILLDRFPLLKTRWNRRFMGQVKKTQRRSLWRPWISSL